MTDPKKFFSALVEQQCTAIVLMDEAHHICYLNNSAELLFARSDSRAQGVHITDLFQSDSSLPEFTSLDNPNSSLTQREARWTLGNERGVITVDYMMQRIQIEGTPYILLEVQHIDRLKKISRDEEFFAKQETTRHLVRGVAHEIKNPLGGIRGAAQLLARELPDESLTDYTNVIIEEADRLRNLVDRMLGSSKILRPQKTNIHEVLERICQLTRAETHNGVLLERDYDPSVPDLDADSEQLIQAILNIVGNAVQALMEARITDPTIIIRTRIARRFTIGQKCYRLVCRIDVEDNGPGIPEEIAENIFYPMISGRAGGTGLGLSIAQQIISQHNGIIECQSRPGETRFTIYLPLGDHE
ncbi:nitrogen regulation protein NR(II) [Gynuella sp.]|uniref:nitrogen regulation protein NR(II) n=1 Tax=Gynuella sp. TaxID=2969146 RepID=UPI003D141899